jgi:hypothetical protein
MPAHSKIVIYSMMDVVGRKPVHASNAQGQEFLEMGPHIFEGEHHDLQISTTAETSRAFTCGRLKTNAIPLDAIHSTSAPSLVDPWEQKPNKPSGAALSATKYGA